MGEHENEHQNEHQNEDENVGAAAPKKDQRKVFIRDAALFHGKLLLDGLRDFILFPAALIAALVDVVRRDDPPGRHFYDVVHFGQQTERWIDLFEVVDRAPETDMPRPTLEGPSLDNLVDEVEAKLRAGHEKGEISAAAKQAIDQILEAAKKAVNKSRG
jgi:hypothetical protein